MGALCCISKAPTRVEPVKEILRTTSLAHKAFPISEASSPTVTLITPAGKPACSAKCANAKALKGVSSEGRVTTVQPTANAGDILRVIMAKGKFHGVMAPTTPIGCLIATTRRSFAEVGITEP